MSDAAVSELSGVIDLAIETVEEVQPAFATGTVTAEALTQACLDRIAIWHSHHTAIVFINPDALETARASDRRRAAGETLGSLDGVPIVVKDATNMMGFPTTALAFAYETATQHRRPPVLRAD